MQGGNVEFHVGADTKQFKKDILDSVSSVKALENAFNSASRESQRLEKEVASSAEAAKKLKSVNFEEQAFQLKELNDSLNAQKQYVDELTAKYKEISKTSISPADIEGQKQIIQDLINKQNELMIKAQQSGDYNKDFGMTYSQIEAEIAIVNASIDILRGKIRDLVIEQSKMTDESAKLGIDTNIEEIERQIESFESKYQSLKSELEKTFVIDDSELRRVSYDLSIAEQELAEMEKIVKLNIDNSEIEKIKIELDIAKKELIELSESANNSITFDEALKQARDMNNEIDTIKKNIETLQENGKTPATIKSLNEQLKIAQNEVKTLQKNFNEASVAYDNLVKAKTQIMGEDFFVGAMIILKSLI